MAADLAVIVRKAIGIRGRFRQEERPDVFVRICRKQHYIGRLKVLLSILNIRHTGGPAVLVDFDGRYASLCDDFAAACRLRFWDRGNRSRAFGVDMTTTSS